MIIVNGEAVGSGVPKGGIPAPQAETPKPAKPKPVETKPTKPEPVETKPVEPVEPEPEAEEQPKEYASKADWVAWAVSEGADEAEAEALTKHELIELYGGAE